MEKASQAWGAFSISFGQWSQDLGGGSRQRPDGSCPRHYLSAPAVSRGSARLFVTLRRTLGELHRTVEIADVERRVALQPNGFRSQGHVPPVQRSGPDLLPERRRPREVLTL